MVQIANQCPKHVRISVVQLWGKRAELAPGVIEVVTRRKILGLLCLNQYLRDKASEETFSRTLR